VNTNAEAAYIDSSAIVKLVNVEAESEALDRFLQQRAILVSSVLARVEVVRAARRYGLDAVELARTTLNTFLLRELDNQVLNDAADLDTPVLRTLDAIHVATALSFGSELAVLVTYDNRMSEAAEALGIPVASPGR
jgi:predicted nucleic acid-binding protein